MSDSSLMERRRYNDLIESTDSNCCIYIRNIHTYNQTERNASVLELYERLYSEFDLLFILTSNLDKIKEEPAVNMARGWLEEHKKIQSMNEKTLLEACIVGSDIAFKYHNTLMDKGYITLPGR